MKNLPPRLLCLIVLALLAFAVSSCLATTGYVDERDDATYERVTKAATKAARPVDNVIPGASDFVEATYNDEPMREPPAGGGFPWEEIGGVALALLGIPASVGVTNHIRDKRRRNLNEATNRAEAAAMGYYEPQQPKEV